MAVLFSSRDNDVIDQKIGINFLRNKNLSGIELEDFYELPRCAEWIKSNHFTKVALQFPDNLLKDSTAVALWLKQNTVANIYILGDTSYGSCCVDEIAAQHVSADSVIHFGHACLSPTKRLLVLYIYGKLPVSVSNVINEFQHLFPDIKSKVILLYEVHYAHIIDEIARTLKDKYKNLLLSNLYLQDSEFDSLSNVSSYFVDGSACDIKKCGRRIQIQQNQLLCDYGMFYIGHQNQTLSNFMLTFNKCRFYSYNPQTEIGRQETLDVNKYLRKRYYYIEKAKDARIIGILVGTLGVNHYVTVINHLKSVIKEARKKSYTLVVGKLNCAKLANFSEIEVFVYVSCYESAVIDSHEFYQPIITPYELEIACNQAYKWTGDYVTDFTELLPGAAAHIPLSVNTDTVNEVSLLTGKMRYFSSSSETVDETCPKSSIAIRNEMKLAKIHANAAGECLANRSWKGLEQQLGETDVAEVVKGKSGIASEYEEEAYLKKTASDKS